MYQYQLSIFSFFLPDNIVLLFLQWWNILGTRQLLNGEYSHPVQPSGSSLITLQPIVTIIRDISYNLPKFKSTYISV